jgi:hypothetical protein
MTPFTAPKDRFARFGVSNKERLFGERTIARMRKEMGTTVRKEVLTGGNRAPLTLSQEIGSNPGSTVAEPSFPLRFLRLLV